MWLWGEGRGEEARSSRSASLVGLGTRLLAGGRDVEAYFFHGGVELGLFPGREQEDVLGAVQHLGKEGMCRTSYKLVIKIGRREFPLHDHDFVSLSSRAGTGCIVREGQQTKSN